MKNTIQFSLSVLLVLLVAGFLTYNYGLPLLENSSISCVSVSHRGDAFGCYTKAGGFFTFLVLGIVFCIGLLWSHFFD